VTQQGVKNSSGIRTIPFLRVVCTGLVIFAATGCETAKRLVPPGFVKYEDIAKDIPPNPVITQRIRELGIDGKSAGADPKPKYPRLSEQPAEAPRGLDTQQREAEIARLLQMRNDANEAIMAARSAAAAPENGFIVEEQDLKARAAALQAEIAKLREELAAEQAQSLPAPLDTSKAPPPDEPL